MIRVAAGWVGILLVAAGAARGAETAALPVVATPAAQVRLVLIGPLEGRGAEVLKSLTLLSPTAMVCTGDMIGRGDAAGFKELVGGMHVPVFPCVGSEEARLAAGQYEATFGKRYFSTDIGRLHVIALDSEEEGGFGEEQLAWLQQDLNRTFQAGRCQGVIVVMHRALWEGAGAADWKAVQGMLVAFNRRPVVQVEGMTAGAPATPPRVAAVFAGTGVRGTGGYRADPTVEGIGYHVLGPVGGEVAVQGDARTVGLLTFEAGREVGLALLPTTASAAPVLPADNISGAERAVVDGMAVIPAEAMGPVGALEGGSGKLVLRLSNPLGVAVEVSVSVEEEKDPLAGVRAVAGEPMRSGIAVAGLPKGRVRLAAGDKKEFPLAVQAGPGGGWSVPRFEISVSWTDERKREWRTVLVRPAAVARGAKAGG